MGAITRSLGNNITTGGVILPAGITNSSVSAVTAFSGYTTGGTLKLLSTQTASSSANISFTTGLDSTYDAYEFHFINVKNSTATQFQFNGSTDGGSNYNVTKTTTYFVATHAENDAEAALVYATANDLAQSTGYQYVVGDLKFDTDASLSGVLQLFNPSSTTYVKHFISRCNYMQLDPSSQEVNMAGYFNTTSAINAINFRMTSGNIADGIIKLYGVKKELIMGSITRSFANNFTTSGVLLPASLTNNSIANVTAYNAAIATGNMVLISSQTASNSASISFTTGIDSTYKEYQFWFINIAPRTDSVNFTFNLSTDSGSNYNVTKTTTLFGAYQNEAGTDTALSYFSAYDLAQSTGYQNLCIFIGNGADENCNGTMSLFNPSSTTYVKHFISNLNGYDGSDYSRNDFGSGYGNTTSAVNAVQFKMSSGNMDGTILMYGIK